MKEPSASKLQSTSAQVAELYRKEFLLTVINNAPRTAGKLAGENKNNLLVGFFMLRITAQIRLKKYP
jgi:hypothetical protein